MPAYPYLNALMGGVLGAVVGFLLASGRPIEALIAASLGTIIAVALSRLAVARARARGEVLYDEMHLALAAYSGLAAVKISLGVICAALIITMWPRILGFELVPSYIGDRLYPGLALSLAVLTTAYWGSYIYYAKSRRTIEG